MVAWNPVSCSAFILRSKLNPVQCVNNSTRTFTCHCYVDVIFVYCEEHFKLHEEDGRCEKSRTFNGIIYSNMQRKSVAKKELVNIIIPGEEQNPELFQNIKNK